MKKLLLATSAVLMFAASSAFEAQAQQTNPKLKLPPKKITVLLPDLQVMGVEVVKTGEGYLDRITVVFKNTCGVAAKGKFDLRATFKESNKAGSKVLHTVSSTFDGLAGGESHKHLFSVDTMKLPAGVHIRVEVDAANQIKEDVENNNLVQRNPDISPFPEDGSTHCKPKG